jgi:DNA gyrase subunit A
MNNIEKNPNIIDRSIVEELQNSYIDYAMSVIVSRALPDIRDGLKPVQRRILYAMKTMNNYYDIPHKKSSAIIGEVLGKYHPHGNEAIYDAITRLAQDFICNIPLIEGQGNFGSIDGDKPAAMRYTGIRLAKISSYLLENLRPEVVDFVPNYDEKEMMPSLLPAAIPQLFINGASGIAVGIASNIPSHNLNELCDGIIAYIDNPQMSSSDFMKYIPGPDFPTKGIICGTEGIFNYYTTGKGTLILRGKVEINQEDNTLNIVELPYQTNKALLVEHIANLVVERKITGITSINDESDSKGISIKIKLSTHASADVVLNNLYNHTKLQSYFHVNAIALIDNKPQVITMKEYIDHFVTFRFNIINKELNYEYKQLQDRLHILDGLYMALSSINVIINTIQSSLTNKEALTNLGKISFQEKYLTNKQGQAILDLKLSRLTSLEKNKLHDEIVELNKRSKEIEYIFSNEKHTFSLIKKQLEEVKNNFPIARKSYIAEAVSKISEEELITPEKMIVFLSKQGYIKSQSQSLYESQRRYGIGKQSSDLKAGDKILQILSVCRTDQLIFFTNKGKAYTLKVYHITEGMRVTRGQPINNFLPIEKDEHIQFFMVLDKVKDYWIFFITKQGFIKKTSLNEFTKKSTELKGLKSIILNENDEIVQTILSPGDQDVMLFSNTGYGIRFSTEEVRKTSRNSRGVIGMRLSNNSEVISAITIDPTIENGEILTISKNGYGKRSLISSYRKTMRGCKGVKAMRLKEDNLLMVCPIQEEDEVLLITTKGIISRCKVKEIRLSNRFTLGVRLMKTKSEDHITNAEIIKNKIMSNEE